jgi:hypothetical protein
MPFSLVAWSESQDTGAVLTEVAALADQHITTDGDDILVPEWAPNLAAVAALGATITQAQISSPSLRQRTLLDVRPINTGAEPLGAEAWMPRFTRPIPLTPGEGLRALVAEGAAGAEQETVLVWLEGEREDLQAGDIETIRCTSATTLTPYAWTLCTLTLSQQLRAGTYAIVGMRAESAGGIAARLVIPGSQFRPGVVAYDAGSDRSPREFWAGEIGVYGTFDHRFIPQVEFLSVSADTAETVHLDVIKIA